MKLRQWTTGLLIFGGFQRADAFVHMKRPLSPIAYSEFYRHPSSMLSATMKDNNSKAGWSAITKASLLIAGTTVGGGFLALPQTVVVPFGGFPVTAVSLSVVWIFLLAQSWILCRSIVQCYKETGRNGLGITYVAQHVLGAGKPALFLLVVLTEATLVSQLARAGILYAAGSSSMIQYQIGCVLAAVTGAILSLRDEGVATNSNAFMTTVFLGAAALLFQAGQIQADWSKCLVSASTVTVSTISKAVPTMLQLLVYGEILPTVCHMLNYNLCKVRSALILGSFIPLVLLCGWAALGVALLPTLSTDIDPVIILLQHSASIQFRLTILAAAAIGTTILGSFLALRSAYNDVAVDAKKEWLQRPAVSTMALICPPLAVSLISPSLFFKAIDFAGAYPVLLLYGVLPPLISFRMNGSKKRLSWTVALGLLSICMVGVAAVKDMQSISMSVFRWLNGT